MKILLFAITLLYSTLSISSECPYFYYNDVKPIVKSTNKELCFDKFVIEFSTTKKSPLWSAEILTREDVLSGVGKPRINNFRAETKLNKMFQATNKDYENTGYDRGHLTPYKDQANSKDINSLSNIVPQSPKLNRGKWENLEGNIRKDAIQYGKLYVITGVVLNGDEKIGNKIPIPSHMYKVVYYPSKVKAFIAENKDDVVVYETTINTIEKVSGIVFTKNP